MALASLDTMMDVALLGAGVALGIAVAAGRQMLLAWRESRTSEEWDPY